MLMLAALCFAEPRRRWMSLRLRPPAVKSELVKAGSGRFLRITAETGRNGRPNWNDVKNAAGREASRLLLPRGISPPPEVRIAPFQGTELFRRLMAATAVELLKSVSINPRLIKISIYDPQAAMPDLPLLYLPYASDVRVVTKRPERYKAQQYTAMLQFGAVLTVTGETAQTNGSLLLIAPDGLSQGDENFSVNGWILTTRYNESYAKGVIHGYLPRVPHSLLTLTPPGCDTVQFLSGLYELSNVREIAAKPPEFLQTGGHTITLKDAAWRLAGIDIGISV